MTFLNAMKQIAYLGEMPFLNLRTGLFTKFLSLIKWDTVDNCLCD